MTVTFDLVSIFPDYFAPLELSLMGKARDSGALKVNVHDLRDWAEGKHRSVDDSPAGGGAGMVMRADVWGAAIDQLRQPGNSILAIPTPAGHPLTQRKLEELASAEQIIVACGRYEGIDDRVANAYREQGMAVCEFSLGDYVLNGGEIAAMVLVEGVGRLQGSFMGNPDSLREESHGPEGLLEYPNYTNPHVWRGLEVPPVLKSGDHAAIARWRRDQALRRTATRRPDLLSHLTDLDSRDQQVLAEEGWLVGDDVVPVVFEAAIVEDAAELAELAARTFPDACPPGLPETDIERFLEENLSQAAFADYLANPERWKVFVARTPAGLAAYTLTESTAPPGLGPKGSAYLSKCYTDAELRGSGVTAALLEKTLADIDAPAVVLATNCGNRRAARFYKRMGFKKAGRRDFYVGDYRNVDDVFVCDLTTRSAKP